MRRVGHPPNNPFYDAENRIKTVAGVNYTYDGDGKRVKKDTGKLYWTGMGSDPLAESDLSGNVNEEFIFLNGKRIARLDLPSGTVHYYFSDHLGSTSVVTDAQGSGPCNDGFANVEEESDYYPFGGERVICSGPNRYKFTGKERDTETGLDYIGARHYASALGRFVRPDSSGLGLFTSNPQALNAYTYSFNNPTTVTDSSGKFPSWIHEWIIDSVFMQELSPSNRRLLAQVSEFADRDQSREGAYAHSMNGFEGGTPRLAQAMTDQYVNAALWTAAYNQVSYEMLHGPAVWAPEALFYFGLALHAVTDADSPWHSGFQDYQGTSGLSHLAEFRTHVVGESITTTADKWFRSADIIKARIDAEKLWKRYLAMLEAEKKRRGEEEKKKKCAENPSADGCSKEKK